MSFTTQRWAARCCFMALAMLSAITTALQVTPDSPCASLCLDPSTSGMVDSSMPNMHPNDIICNNRDLSSEKGQRFQSCMNCLQNSTYTTDSQNDQAWFMYNLQYSFAHCVFDYPNGSVGIGPYPCMTSEACGPLKTTVSKSLANNTGGDPYAYCNYKGGSALGDTFGKCLDCLRPDKEHGYVANYFVALEAGCEQRAGAHGRLALNDTLFANSTIGILNPNKPSKSRSVGLSSGALIAVIVLCVLIGLGAICGAAFLLLRRRHRRNRYNKSALEYAASKNHRRGAAAAASMDSCCPAAPANPLRSSNERDGAATAAAAAAPADAAVPLPRYATAADEKAGLAAADKKQQPQPGMDALRSHPPAGPVRNFSHKQNGSSADAAAAVEENPVRLDKVMTSPSSSSPYSPDSYVTPSSATSATPFFAPGQTSAFSPVSPPSSRAGLAKQPSWEGRSGGGGGLLRSKGSKTDVHAPVASRQFQTTFPPPPKR